MASDGSLVLSVQSHVVHGYVGNRSAVFPLQLLGFEVDVINSVQFNCRLGYPVVRGQKLTGEDLRDLVEGLEGSKVLTHTHLLTGFIGTPSFLREVAHLLDKLPSSCKYFCDPVMGDNGVLYVSADLVDVYRNEILPRASVLTPNQFEAEKLTQMTITNMQDAFDACDCLHKMGPQTIVITTLDVPEATQDGNCIAMLLSESNGRKWILQLPFIKGGPFFGTGDMTSAMLLAWTTTHPTEAPLALEKTGAVMQAVIRRTEQAPQTDEKRPELKIIASKRDIEDPPVTFRCRLVNPVPPVLRGILIDDSHWLTENAGNLDWLCDVPQNIRIGTVTRKGDSEIVSECTNGDFFIPIDVPVDSPLLEIQICKICLSTWGLSCPGQLCVISNRPETIMKTQALGCVTVSVTNNDATADWLASDWPAAGRIIGRIFQTS